MLKSFVQVDFDVYSKIKHLDIWVLDQKNIKPQHYRSHF